MNARKQTTQRALFESEFPNWNSLPREAQQSLLDVLSQLLLDALEQHASNPITTSTTRYYVWLFGLVAALPFDRDISDQAVFDSPNSISPRPSP